MVSLFDTLELDSVGEQGCLPPPHLDWISRYRTNTHQVQQKTFLEVSRDELQLRIADFTHSRDFADSVTNPQAIVYGMQEFMGLAGHV